MQQDVLSPSGMGAHSAAELSWDCNALSAVMCLACAVCRLLRRLQQRRPPPSRSSCRGRGTTSGTPRAATTRERLMPVSQNYGRHLPSAPAQHSASVLCSCCIAPLCAQAPIMTCRASQAPMPAGSLIAGPETVFLNPPWTVLQAGAQRGRVRPGGAAHAAAAAGGRAAGIPDGRPAVDGVPVQQPPQRHPGRRDGRLQVSVRTCDLECIRYTSSASQHCHVAGSPAEYAGNSCGCGFLKRRWKL